MYKYQKESKVNSNDDPYTSEVKKLRAEVLSTTSVRRRLNYEDRGQDTFLDGYNEETQLRNVLFYYWEHSKLETGLRNNLCFLISHSTLLRGDNIRRLELADLFCIKLANENNAEILTYIVDKSKLYSRIVLNISEQHLLIHSAKTIKDGEKNFTFSMRNKLPEFCALGALGFYFFYRWHLSGESFPCFDSNKDWYDIKVIQGKGKLTDEISYSAHRQGIKEGIQFAKIGSSKITHIMRGSGARMAEIGGALPHEIMKLGLWNSNLSVLEKTYLGDIPVPAVKVQAGFTREVGSVFLPRSQFEPPDELMKLIFPWVESVIQDLEQKKRKDLSTSGFLQLLKRLRVIILQDACFLVEKFPKSAVWRHPVFSSTEFERYRVTVTEGVKSSIEPGLHLLSKAAPAIVTELSAMTMKIDHLHEKIDRIEKTKEQRTNVTVTINSDGNGTHSTISRSGTSSNSKNKDTVNVFTMDRNLVTVASLWEEYNVGTPCIREMDEKYGAAWRSSANDRQHYLRRKLIWGEVLRLINDDGFSEANAVQKLEKERRTDGLFKLNKRIGNRDLSYLQ